MKSIKLWWAGITLQRRLQLLIQGCLIVIFLVGQHWLEAQFERRALAAAEERTVAVADGLINGLNTLMVTKIDGKDVSSDPASRALFIHKMGASEGIKELRVVRGKGVNDAFGPGLPQEQAADDLDRSVLAGGKLQFSMNRGAGSLRAVIPFVAMKEFRTSPCLDCHAVAEGSVLGVASVTTDIKDDLAAMARFSAWMWAGQVLAQIALFVTIGWIVKRSLRQLGAEPAQAARLAQSVAAGDLGQRVELRPGDKHSLMAQLKSMQESLAKVVGRVRQGAEGVATASTQIAQGNSDLSSRTEKQASALQQTAASMEGLGSQVRQSAEHARQANQLAVQASAAAVDGGQAVSRVIETMGGINDASHRIADIISVIDGIAFQTNILALNAAVEAARAGDHGRGFAVVASEVRSLAGRSAEAAREITALITASVERVEQGTILVNQAGGAMRAMVESIGRVTDIMGKISSASDGQSQDVAKVGEAISQIDQMTQQNAALVEEMAAAAESLKAQAQDLVRSVRVFQLDAAEPAGS